jgi:cytochrome c oxidase assembly protein subunit 11
MADDIARKNRRTLGICVSVVAGMIGLSYASVPLYELFCRVTGFGGTTQVATQAPETVSEQTIRVRFDASINPQLGWRFEPAQREVEVRLGETMLVFYTAENIGTERSWGTATFNVTPLKVGQYFSKIACFCFTEQHLDPGERIEMPVTFFVDPRIADDPNARDVKTITLSYTFHTTELPEGYAALDAGTAGNPAPTN